MAATRPAGGCHLLAASTHREGRAQERPRNHHQGFALRAVRCCFRCRQSQTRSTCDRGTRRPTPVAAHDRTSHNAARPVQRHQFPRRSTLAAVHHEAGLVIPERTRMRLSLRFRRTLPWRASSDDCRFACPRSPCRRHRRATRARTVWNPLAASCIFSKATALGPTPWGSLNSSATHRPFTASAPLMMTAAARRTHRTTTVGKNASVRSRFPL